LEAFKRGRLRILGDTELGSHLLRQVAKGGGLRPLGTRPRKAASAGSYTTLMIAGGDWCQRSR